MQALSNRPHGGASFVARMSSLVLAAFLVSPLAARSDEVRSNPERAKLMALVATKVSNAAVVGEITAKANLFEHRMQDTAEIGDTYDAIANLLSSDQSIVDADERSQLALQILSQGADPSSINQGHHNTCALAALESRTFNRFPSTAARLITEAAINGKFHDSLGNQIVLDASNIHGDMESIRGGEEGRSHASQLFQLCAANAFWQTKSVDPRGIRCGKGRIQYIQKKPHSLEDTGERLVIKWNDGVIETIVEDSGVPMSQPCFGLADIQEVAGRLMSGKQETFVIGSNKFDKSQKYLGVKNIDELRASLVHNLNRSGQALPMVAAVNPERGCFKVDSDSDGTTDMAWYTVRANLQAMEMSSPRTLSGGRSNPGWHAVCVTAYDSVADTVSVDNFWGPKFDHFGKKAVKLSEFFDAMQNAQ